jgi:CAAX protease family protein
MAISLTRSTTRGRSAATPADRPAVVIPQYSRRQIFAVWAAAAIPMGLMSWVAAPVLADHIGGASALTRMLLVTLTIGLAWQFVLVMALVAREQGSLRWSVLKEALWLRRPQSPRTGKVGGRVWLVLIPMTIGLALEELLPHLPTAHGRDMGKLMDSPAGHQLFQGAWGWFALVAALALFNTVLGEELLFRGFLLPRMQGAFGKGDWVVNGVLFACYHLHEPWIIPLALVDALFLAYPARRYQSAVLPIIVHSVQSVVILAGVLALVVG